MTDMTDWGRVESALSKHFYPWDEREFPERPTVTDFFHYVDSIFEVVCDGFWHRYGFRRAPKGVIELVLHAYDEEAAVRKTLDGRLLESIENWKRRYGCIGYLGDSDVILKDIGLRMGSTKRNPSAEVLMYLMPPLQKLDYIQKKRRQKYARSI
jgi:hypothetical protein